MRRARRPGRHRRNRFLPSLEVAEARVLLATFFVTNTRDYDPLDPLAIPDGTLRKAMVEANARPGADNVEFGIPASSSYPFSVPVPGFDPILQLWTIELTSPLPVVTETVTIDGYSQAHLGVPFRYPDQLVPAVIDPVFIRSVPNTVKSLDGNDAKIRVVLSGEKIDRATYPDPTGFVLAASHSNLRGLAIDGFADAVRVPAGPYQGNRIQGNAIGGYLVYPVDPKSGEALPAPAGIGYLSLGNSGDGVALGSTNAAVGGSAPQDANSITNSRGRGVWIQPGAEGNIVLGNQIGVVGPAQGVYVQAGNGEEGVLVEASSNAVGGAVDGAGNVISANAGDGIRLVGTQSTRNRIEGNYIGAAPGGGYRFGAGDPGNGGDGIRLESAPNNLIGGETDVQRNVISANEGAGVRLTGVGGDGNRLLGNYIGLTSAGASVLGNTQEGVRVDAGAIGNTIGAGNVISGNLTGILVAGPQTTGTIITGCLIGTDATGQADLGNTHEGIRIEDSANNSMVGDGAGSQVISGNNVGVAFVGANSRGNLLIGTYIGTDKSGKLDVNNSQQGILIQNAPGNTIGGTVAAARNVVSGNHWGVDVAGAGSSLNLIQGNLIGVDSTGTGPLGNEVDGVRIRDGASGNLIGGAGIEAGNIIAFNRRDGIRVEGSSDRDAILTNSVHSNRGLGVNLVAATDAEPGETPNDPDDLDSGPNQLQNAPVLTTVRTSTDYTNLQGSLRSRAGLLFVVQFFANPAPGVGEVIQGKRYLGETEVTTDGTGFAVFSADVAGIVLSGELVTATATDVEGNSSEFSAGLAEVLGTVQFTVANYQVDEGSGLATITVSRSGGSGGRATVQYSTAGGTAQPSVDYIPASGTLVFDIGAESQEFTIPILDDPVAEAEETVGLILSSASGAAKLGSPARATLRIVDNDQPGTISFGQLVYSVREDIGAATITVVRAPAGVPVTVLYATSGGTAIPGVDYVPVTGVIAFGAGQGTQVFQVPILFHAASKANTTVGLMLSQPTGGALLGTPSTATLRIEDVTAPRIIGARAIPGRLGSSVFVLEFDQPLIGGRAEDLRNYGYSIQVAPPGRRPGSRADRLVAVRSAIYDVAAWTVTLTTTTPIAAGRQVLLQVNQVTDVLSQPVGVAGLDGMLIDGNGDGRPGGVFRAVLRIPKTRPISIRRG